MPTNIRPVIIGGSDGQESGRDIFSDIQLLSNILHCVYKDTSDQLHPDPGYWERTISPHNMAKSVVFFDVLSRY